MSVTDDNRRLVRLGCVSFLNAKPLIHGLEERAQAEASGSVRVEVRYDVPSRLLEDLERGEVDVALCPVIDYHRSAVPLRMVPVGGIGCEGPTLTVRLFSRVPIERIDAVHADTDSHTSVALMRVLLKRLHGLTPTLIDWTSGKAAAEHADPDYPEAMLLIGDKVVTQSPRAALYPYQLDLGDAWRTLTGLPFVFATWLARADRDLGDLPPRLAQQRETNLSRTDAIAQQYAPTHGWPTDLARQYLGEILQYRIGPSHLQAMQRFAAYAEEDGLIENARAMRRVS